MDKSGSLVKTTVIVLSKLTRGGGLSLPHNSASSLPSLSYTDNLMTNLVKV